MAGAAWCSVSWLQSYAALRPADICKVLHFPTQSHLIPVMSHGKSRSGVLIPIQQMAGLSPHLLVKGHAGASQTAIRSPGSWSLHLPPDCAAPERDMKTLIPGAPSWREEKRQGVCPGPPGSWGGEWVKTSPGLPSQQAVSAYQKRINYTKTKQFWGSINHARPRALYTCNSPCKYFNCEKTGMPEPATMLLED